MGCYEHTRDPTQEHECVEKLKSAQATENGSEQTHLGVVDPFPKVGGAGPKIHIGPMSKDPMHSSVDLHIGQPLRARMVGTTWPWIYPHGRLPLIEWLNPMAKKGPQNVLAPQPFM
jgi:hypothetical protein